MKKYFILIFITIVSNYIQGQETEGEATTKRIKKIFKKEYSFNKYDKYNGLIEYQTYKDSLIVFNFNQESIIKLSHNDSIFIPLFSRGILYPHILRGGKQPIYICCFENLNYTKPIPTKKRFSIWVFTEGFMNPSLFLIELTNKNTARDNSFESFLDNSYLSYIKYAWTIL